MNYDTMPLAIYTIPEVANVGLSEAQAKERGYQTRSDKVLFRTIGKSQVIGEIEGEVKIISAPESGKILGVHMIGPHASDLIAEGVLAIKMGAKLRDLSETLHAHPTLTEIMHEVSLQGIREQRK